ncbi:winged helix-turn-helix transcriptional regulator [Smaragdicoccus niigatensis]|uniref:winged helix-turn-helix transcriptional regulator n=1 Tax=Smaragdicoccus niigatensis TaxID=359359 RepID=UPI00037F81DA|nr:helix-turn-helix domain-containing protein [Smaragdicoccus niigatensis]
MSEYGNFCPVALASEVVADRWTPLIIRELVLGNTRFNDIARGLGGISRTLLVQRLRHLERKGVVETWPSPTGRGSEYHLTPAGKDLERVIDSLGRWAIEWLFDELRPHDVDAITLTWWMHRRIRPDRFPPRRTVVEFRHTSPTSQVLWLVLDRGEASVCQLHPGFDIDLTVTASTPALAEVFQGYAEWAEAVSDGRIEVGGTPRLAAALPSWFLWSPWHDVTRERSKRPEPA